MTVGCRFPGFARRERIAPKVMPGSSSRIPVGQFLYSRLISIRNGIVRGRTAIVITRSGLAVTASVRKTASSASGAIRAHDKHGRLSALWFSSSAAAGFTGFPWR
ncbi:MAG TPA: hypothetical protein VG142_01720 [Trebonia sp.]|nr:hypothetical protein [Trebonia sp.]